MSGLSVDAGVVRGGGFLRLDPDKGEYSGALELALFDVISIQAIGLITTRMPDGSRGFSLLIILTAEFGTGIQLGLGFTLLAVGGLLGLNRAMRLDVLAAGIRTGALNSVLFPKDVVANAPRIISDLRAIFPAQQGTFLIGPMVKLGWGTPTLVSLSLGVLIEIPGNVAIVGVLRVALPAEDAPLLVLQVSFLGAIEFDRNRVWFFASLFDSHVLFVPIDGEMGLLAAFGDDSNFVVSVGGFHPAFEAPPLPFPTPNSRRAEPARHGGRQARGDGLLRGHDEHGAVRRACLALLWIQLRASFEGELGFDALFRFSPFSFVIAVSASIGFKVFGVGLFSIHLDFTLEGPTPYRAHGKGGVDLWLVSFSAELQHHVGRRRAGDAAAARSDAAADARARESGELDHDDSRSQQAAGVAQAARSAHRRRAAASDRHAAGGATRSSARSRARQGGQYRAHGRPSLRAQVRGGGLVRQRDAEEKFAPAQFRNLEDADKLSQPAFQPEHAGLELVAPVRTRTPSRAVQRTVRYEEIIIDSQLQPNDHGLRTSGRPALRASAGRQRGRALVAVAKPTSVLACRSPTRSSGESDRFAVASTRDNTAVSANATVLQRRRRGRLRGERRRPGPVARERSST